MIQSEPIAELLVAVAAVYVVAGLAFAVPFVLRGVERIDPGAQGASWGFRLIVLPGVVALWPLLLWRWLRRTSPPVESNAHRDAARRGGGV